MSATTVTVIPPTTLKLSSLTSGGRAKKRVAAYARVSTDTDEQLSSYGAQVDHYTRHILANPDWIFIDVYTDEGISATSTKKRDGFNQMIADALAGKIDLIITKSVSRFARNTVDTLTTVRQLKEKGVEVYFEKENIYTLDSKGELLITIMSSLAQEESRSISENVTWGQRKRMADGKVVMPYRRFLGYEKGEDGMPHVVEAEAAIVRLIYGLFLEGKTPHGIATHLTASGIPTPGGKEKWHIGTIKSILTNEKYKGDALLQKSFTLDFLTKKKKLNQGEVPQYYVRNSHPAIVSTEVYDMVQEEMKQRRNGPGRHSGTSIFASRVVCGECGGYYGAKVWHSTDKYRKSIMQCNRKFDGAVKCGAPNIDEDALKSLFVTAVNRLTDMKDEIFANYEVLKVVIFDTTQIETELTEQNGELKVTAALIRQCVQESTSTEADQDGYNQRYEGLVQRFEVAQARVTELEEQRQQMTVRREIVESFLETLDAADVMMTQFDKTLWCALVDKVVIYSATDVRFTFKDGTAIKI